MTTVSYRCTNCLDHSVTRDYDVSHLSRACDACDDFGRFVHEGVLAKYREFEDSPPADFAWSQLERMEKFVVAEGLVRQGKTLDDYGVRSEENGDAGVDEDGASDDERNGETPS